MRINIGNLYINDAFDIEIKENSLKFKFLVEIEGKESEAELFIPNIDFETNTIMASKDKDKILYTIELNKD